MPRTTLAAPTLIALAILLCGAAGPPAFAQQPPLSAQAQKVHDQVAALPMGSKISVIARNAPETYGTLLTAEPATFTYHDVDDNLDKTLSYEAVKKVKVGYGGYNSLHHRHTDRTKVLVITVIFVAGLLALVFAATAS